MAHWLRNRFSGDKSKSDTVSLIWQEARYQPVRYLSQRQVQIGTTLLHNQSLRLGSPFDDVAIQTLSNVLYKYGGTHPLEKAVTPQLAAAIYDATNKPHAMAMYFPITDQLGDVERQEFESAVERLMQNPNFGLYIWDADLAEVTNNAPPSIAYLIAGHVIELFFYRPDLMMRLFSTPRIFNIYMNERAYTEDGGIAGGCYDPLTGSIKLIASRLYEGFFGEHPGVAPFIHEFGHMLDAFDVSTASICHGRGLLPGMHETDGDLFSFEARDLFIKGKRLELERYERARLNQSRNDDNIPIGHPYVFQSDGEFIAGYLEMFFRNPNYFYQLNPTLFQGFATLFKQDPRTFWERDFDYYIDQNRAVYLNHRQGINPPGLHILS